MLKEILKDTNKRKHSIFRDWNTLLLSTVYKAIYGFNSIPIKILMSFFAEKEENHPKIHKESQRTLNSQNNPEKE